MTSFVFSSRISKFSDSIYKASDKSTTVVSPALTSLSVKSYVALSLNVTHCSKSFSRLPPALFAISNDVMASIVLLLAAFSAKALFKLREKMIVNKQIMNEKKAIFFLFTLNSLLKFNCLDIKRFKYTSIFY